MTITKVRIGKERSCGPRGAQGFQALAMLSFSHLGGSAQVFTLYYDQQCAYRFLTLCMKVILHNTNFNFKKSKREYSLCSKLLRSNMRVQHVQFNSKVGTRVGARVEGGSELTKTHFES